MAWLVFLACSAAGMIIHALVPEGLPQDVIYQLFGLAAVLAIVLGVRMHRPNRPLAWYLMAAGQLSWSIADAVGTWGGDTVGDEHVPSPADPIYLTGYAFVAAGMLLLIRGRRFREDLGGFLDSAILTVALSVLSWVLLARPTVDAYQDSPAAAVVGLAYPIADIVLAAGLIRLVTTPGGRTRSFRLLVTALALLITADTFASAFNMLDYAASEPVDYLWLASYAAWGAAALEPSMASLTQPVIAAEATLSRRRLATLTVAMLVAPGTLALQHLFGARLDVWAVVIGSVSIVVLVIARINLSVREITAANAQREEARLELLYQASHDGLTGLPNRAQAMELIRRALSRAQRSGGQLGLLFVDLDGFKKVNDTFGHRAGDDVLRETAARMQAGVRGGDVVARLGGDEFIVLLEPLVDQTAAMVVAERLVRQLAEPIAVSSGRWARIGASIGLATNSDGGIDPDRFIDEADQAAYRAKAAGRGRVEVFESSLRDELALRRSIETALIEAVRGDQVSVGSTRIVDLASRKVVGLELEPTLPAPDGTLLSRPAVIDVVENTQAGCDLDAWVLRHCAALEHDGDLFLAVPITARHLAQPRALDDVQSALAAGVAPSSLMLVVPPLETLDELRALEHLSRLRGLGVSICIDGFGAGSTATDRWQHLPLDYVRLDSRLLSGAVGPLLLRLTVETAHAFGYRVLAPRFATEDQVAALTDAGCDLGPGPLVDRQPIMASPGRPEVLPA